jgi:hypothetical protein
MAAMVVHDPKNMIAALVALIDLAPSAVTG